MPALSYVTMRTRVALNLGNMQSSHPFYTYIGSYVNDALNGLPLRAVNMGARNYELFPELQEKWTVLTTQDQAWVDIPTTTPCLAPQMVYSFDSSTAPNLSTSDRKPVVWVSQNDYELMPKSTTITGYPRLYTAESTKLYLHPTPRSGYTTYLLIKGVKAEAELSADGDLPVVDKRWHSAIVDYACALLAADMGWAEDSARFLASCDQKITACLPLRGLRNRRTAVIVTTPEGM